MLWRDQVIGWANLSANDGSLKADLGYVNSTPRDSVFRQELEAELKRVKTFLRLSNEI